MESLSSQLVAILRGQQALRIIVVRLEKMEHLHRFNLAIPTMLSTLHFGILVEV
jgi:hypothetical protein